MVADSLKRLLPTYLCWLVSQLRCVDIDPSQSSFHTLGVAVGIDLQGCKTVATQLDRLIDACAGGSGGLTCTEFGPVRGLCAF